MVLFVVHVCVFRFVADSYVVLSTMLRPCRFKTVPSVVSLVRRAFGSLAVTAVACSGVLLTSRGVAVQVNASSGSFAMLVDGVQWLVGGSSSVAPPQLTSTGASERAQTPQDDSFVIVSATNTSGTDWLGQFERLTLNYAWSTAPAVVVLSTAFTAYADKEVLVFTQAFPEGFNNSHSSSSRHVEGGVRGATPAAFISAFPSFATVPSEAVGELGYVAWGGCQCAAPSAGPWNGSNHGSGIR